MSMSKLFINFLIVGLALMIILYKIEISFLIFYLYNLILVIVYLVDLYLSPKKKDFSIKRIINKNLSIGTKNEVKIKVLNKSKNKSLIFLKDFYNKDFEIFNDYSKNNLSEGNNLKFQENGKKKSSLTKNEFSMEIFPYESKETKYYIIPNKRGKYSFDEIYVKVFGILNLCVKYYKYDIKSNVKVYPNLIDLSRINLTSIKKATLMNKMKKSKIYGIGNEFESLKEYTEGDNYKTINWKASARINKLIVNNYEPEKNQQIYILIDSSRVMNTKINKVKKLDYSINSALVLAKYVLKKDDNVGLTVFDNKVKIFLKAHKGKMHFHNILDNLYDVKENMVSADYNSVFSYINKRESRRGMVFIFTEHFNVEESKLLIDALKLFMKNHLPIIISIKDIRIENIINKYVTNKEDIFLKASAIKISNERENSKRILQNMGIKCLDIEPGKLSIELINKYLQMRSSQKF